MNNTAFNKKQSDYIVAPSLIDFYKAFHMWAFKKGSQYITTNFTPRSGNHSNTSNTGYCFWAGAQQFINNIIVEEWNKFFEVPVEIAVRDYKRVNEAGLGCPCDTSKLEALHTLGYMPLSFRALLEGVEVPYGIPCMTVTNTHPDFYFLPSMIETIQSDEVWPVQTSLSTAAEYMRNVLKFSKIDCTPEWLLPFLCHDFSMRGMMGGTLQGGAVLSGMGHLMSGFVGSDTVPAAFRLEKDYGAYLGLDRPFETIASVPSTEHGVQCSYNNDDLAYFRACMKASPTGILSLVSDGYDFWKLITELLPELKDEIIERDGKIVIRPDSGDPVKVLTGYKIMDLDYLGLSRNQFIYSEMKDKGFDAIKLKDEVRPATVFQHGIWLDLKVGETIPDYEAKGLVQVLYEMFDGTTNENGYKILDSHIGTIYGDSITLERQKQIYERLHAKGFAIANVVLGVGSYSYQYVTRDTHGSAVKATHIVIDGVPTDISKEVKGDSVKKSAKGLLFVTKDGDGNFKLIDQIPKEMFEDSSNLLELVWENGEWKRIQTLEEIRTIVKSFVN